MDISISPVALHSVNAVPPMAFQLLTIAPLPVGTTISINAVGTDRVSLSGLGQLLALLDAFRSSIALSLASRTLAERAQGLIDAFNRLHEGLEQLAILYGTLGNDSTVAQFFRQLDDVARQLVGGGTDAGGNPVAGLGQIGIEFQPGTALTGARLTLNPPVFANAALSQAGTVAARLAEAGQSLVAAATQVNTTLAGSGTALSQIQSLTQSAGLSPDLTTLFGAGTPTGTTLSPLSGTAANSSGLSLGNLAAAGADSTLNSVLSTPGNLTTLPAEPAAGAVTLAPPGAAPPAGVAAREPAVVSSLLASAVAPIDAAVRAEAARAADAAAAANTTPAAATGTPTALTVPAITAAPASPVEADTIAAAQRADAARQALSNLINDPELRALAANRSDPAYASLVAALNLASATPGPLPAGLPSSDLPAAVGAIQRGAGLAGR